MTHPMMRFMILVLTAALLGVTLAQEDAAGADGAAQEGPGSLAAAIRDTPNLSTLTGILEAAGLMDQLEEPARVTFFAPSDRAFETLGEDALEDLLRDRGALDLVMRHHLVFGASPLSALRNLDALTTLEGTRLEITDAGGRVRVEGLSVGEGVAAGQAVLYVVDELLMPRTSVLLKDLLGGPQAN